MRRAESADAVAPSLHAGRAAAAALALALAACWAAGALASNAVCWGHGNTGQLDNGVMSGVNWLAPVEMLGDQTFSSIAGSENTVCALGARGVTHCWVRGG